MSLEERCEISLSGLIVQELWRMLGAQKEQKERLPKGLSTMAPQTVQNMQLIAMTTANICATKEDTFHPWKGAAHSLSEIHIERMFGRYRGQYQHSDLTARGYWNANARVARQQAAKMARSKPSAPHHEKEPPLDIKQCLVLCFYRCFFGGSSFRTCCFYVFLTNRYIYNHIYIYMFLLCSMFNIVFTNE